MKTTYSIIISIFILLLYSCEKEQALSVICNVKEFGIQDKIKGGSVLQTWLLFFESTDDPGNIVTTFDLVEKTNATWVSLSPYLRLRTIGDQPRRPYQFPVSTEVFKMRELIPKLKESGIKNIMLKPLTFFWEIDGSNYWGDFYVETEEEWIEIENALEELIYGLAELSTDHEEIKLLSIGNELSEFSKRRPQFFERLITRIRIDFPLLQLTYSANWDEYKHIDFWRDLDYIGVNPYFPLTSEKEPTLYQIEESFLPIKETLHDFSCEYETPILFTEYGFRSIDYGLWESWNLGEINQANVNFRNQENGYKAFYNTFWNEKWVAGGFFWEWKIPLIDQINNPSENGWYVNDKPVEEIIKSWYE